jgi:hypothetical protein
MMSDTFMANPSFSQLAWQKYTGSDRFYLDVNFMSIGENPRMRPATRCLIVIELWDLYVMDIPFSSRRKDLTKIPTLG